MLVMTAKLSKKKIALIFTAVVLLIAAIVVIFSGGSTATVSPNVSSNDARVEFLKGFGWDVTTSPVESGQVKVPQNASQIFERYNALQKSQGYDLTEYAGKTVMRYVYEVKNYPGATEPVYATVLVYKDKIIGGDITDTSAKGKIQGFQMPSAEE
jgi:hypothetical protein